MQLDAGIMSLPNRAGNGGVKSIDQDTIHLLLVDDDPLFVELVCLCLRKNIHRNYVVSIAYTVREAIDACLCHREPDCCAFDAVLVNYRLPDEKGTHLIATLEAEMGDQAPACVVLTGDQCEEVQRLAYGAGALECLSKDWLTAEKLSERLEDVIRRDCGTCDEGWLTVGESCTNTFDRADNGHKADTNDPSDGASNSGPVRFSVNESEKLISQIEQSLTSHSRQKVTRKSIPSTAHRATTQICPCEAESITVETMAAYLIKAGVGGYSLSIQLDSTVPLIAASRLQVQDLLQDALAHCVLLARPGDSIGIRISCSDDKKCVHWQLIHTQSPGRSAWLAKAESSLSLRPSCRFLKQFSKKLAAVNGLLINRQTYDDGLLLHFTLSTANTGTSSVRSRQVPLDQPTS